jgi:DNA-binding transcriptional ArsR family regulator
MATKTKRTAAQHLAKALSHPLREEVLTILTEREASGAGIARELDEEPTSVNYHIRCLVKWGCAELVAERQVAGAGAVEKFYKAVTRPLIDVAEWEEMHPAVANHFAWRAMAKPVEDFTEAVEAGMLETMEDANVTRTPMLLDLEGRRELFAKFQALLDEIPEVQARSDERRVVSKEEGVRMSASLVCFEMPAKGSA